MIGRPACGTALGRRAALLAVMAAGVVACAPEKRAVGPSPPLSAPVGLNDPRARLYETNAYQIAEGGRMFLWNGCGPCHGETSAGAARLTDKVWAHGGRTTQIYASIADGRPSMPAYANRIPPEQIWQIAGDVRGLPDLPADKRRRQASDQAGEPQGDAWGGPVR
jgi:mono/diheme cytochrome c family protein